MGNIASTATKGTDGYYYMQTCTDTANCPPANPNYKLYNRNASLIPIVSNPIDSSVLLSKEDVEKAIMEDKAKFTKGWWYLDTRENVNIENLEKDIVSYKTPENACLRIEPCDGVVKQHKLCCKNLQPPPNLEISSHASATSPTQTPQTHSTGTNKSNDAKTITTPENAAYREKIFRMVRIGGLVVLSIILVIIIGFITFTAWPIRNPVQSQPGYSTTSYPSVPSYSSPTQYTSPYTTTNTYSSPVAQYPSQGVYSSASPSYQTPYPIDLNQLNR
jgi:hypothetical protein